MILSKSFEWTEYKLPAEESSQNFMENCILLEKYITSSHKHNVHTQELLTMSPAQSNARKFQDKQLWFNFYLQGDCPSGFL
jgi:hypothetical protein